MAADPKTTLPPCIWCGGSRADQRTIRCFDAEGDPICTPCWEKEYGAEFREKHGEAADAE